MRTGARLHRSEESRNAGVRRRRAGPSRRPDRIRAVRVAERSRFDRAPAGRRKKKFIRARPRGAGIRDAPPPTARRRFARTSAYAAAATTSTSLTSYNCATRLTFCARRCRASDASPGTDPSCRMRRHRSATGIARSGRSRGPATEASQRDITRRAPTALRDQPMPHRFAATGRDSGGVVTVRCVAGKSSSPPALIEIEAFADDADANAAAESVASSAWTGRRRLWARFCEKKYQASRPCCCTIARGIRFTWTVPDIFPTAWEISVIAWDRCRSFR